MHASKSARSFGCFLRDLLSIAFEEVMTMSTRDEILQQVLSLPPADQAYVADCVEQQLSNEGFASPEIAEAWGQEIDRRIAAYERGDITAVDADVALDHLRQAISQHRQQRS